ncbi:AAA family ATPase [[Flexibacter] sp. ATCC 35208]|uniref:AAA family ATPase n=1 Tax=[Flexibacter] sp. ATCC 35208 TaxID=1936242 RepID=UPI0015C3D864|nr:ATP-binding protein [[Flexibacter] sp. ATCC 35208]
MIRIIKYNLQHYRNIQSANLSFDNYNLIIGTNNSGKSNFIQSFSFLYFILYGGMEDVTNAFRNGFITTRFRDIIPTNWRNIEDTDTLPPISMELEFENTKTNRKFTYQISFKFQVAENSKLMRSFIIDSESLHYKEYGKPGSPVRIFSRTKTEEHYGKDFPNFKFDNGVTNAFSLLRVLQISGGSNEAYLDSQLCLSQILKTPVFYFSHTELTKNSTKDQLKIFNGRVVAFDLKEEIINLKNSNNWDIFKSALHNVLGIEAVDINTYHLNINKNSEEKEAFTFVHFLHAKTFKSLEDLSDGSILLIALVIKVLNSDHDIFFIEEPENSTHPKALVDLIAFLKSFSETKQFIITSHSIVLLNKSKLEQIITSRAESNGMSIFENVNSRKELKARLRSGKGNFADELFFEQTEEEFD